jgi:hypothetical protein
VDTPSHKKPPPCPPGQGGTSAGVKPFRTIQDPLRARLKQQSAKKRKEAIDPCRFDNPERYGEAQLLTQWTATALSAQALLDTAGVEEETLHLAKGSEPCDECWWIVDVCGREILRSFAPYPALLANQINEAGLRTSRLRARVAWVRSGFGCEIDLDIGSGFRIAVEGADVNVFVLGPRGRMLEVSAATSVPPTGTPGDPNSYVGIPSQPPTILPASDGIVLDTMVAAQVTKCISTNADRTAHLTQTFERPALDADFAIPIPPRAKQLQVSMPPPGLLTPLNFRIGPLAVDPIVQTVFFDIFNLVRSTMCVEIPENASHITLGAADPVFSRRWTLSWKLEF